MYKYSKLCMKSYNNQKPKCCNGKSTIRNLNLAENKHLLPYKLDLQKHIHHCYLPFRNLGCFEMAKLFIWPF